MHHKHHPVKGILFMCGAMFMFTSVNGILKFLESPYDIFHIVFARNFFALIPLFFILRQARHSFSTRYIKTHTVRSVGGVISHVCLFSSILLLPFGDANVLSFSTTLVVCIFSVLFLKEKMTLPQIMALLIGFGGVVIVARPSGNMNMLGVGCALISVILEAVLMTHSRPFTRHEHPARIVFYYALLSTGFSLIGILVLVYGFDRPFVVPSLLDSVRLALFGIGGGVGQYLLTQAYAHAEARIVSPFIYSAMVWSLLYAVFVFGEVLTESLWIGSAFIVGAGLYLLMSHTKIPKKKVVPRECD